ncbi:unnamed protein product, partial [marine sediment metagenome]
VTPFTIDKWNLTLGNLTITPFTLDTWNITIGNMTISPFIIDTWNLTLGNTTISHGILEPSFETVNKWIYYENNSFCDGEQSGSGVTDGAKSYQLSIQERAHTAYCRVYQENINFTDIDHFYADFYLNSDAFVDVPAYLSVRVNGDNLWEQRIPVNTGIQYLDTLIDVSAYGDYCTLEFRLNQTDIFYEDGIFASIDNIRMKIWHTLDTWNITLGNMSVTPYILDTWNVTLGNLTINAFTIDTWNVTLGNLSISSFTIDTWNLTLGNMSISPFTLDTWNVTLGNMTISPFTIDTWNLTLG